MHLHYFLFNLGFFNCQASSAYWRGNKDRESLQRVYGISYPDSKRLKVIFVPFLCLVYFILFMFVLMQSVL